MNIVDHLIVSEMIEDGQADRMISKIRLEVRKVYDKKDDSQDTKHSPMPDHSMGYVGQEAPLN